MGGAGAEVEFAVGRPRSRGRSGEERRRAGDDEDEEADEGASLLAGR